jgi:hypothetical protein
VNSNPESAKARKPLPEFVRTWQAAGATYGFLRVDLESDASRSCVVANSETGALPGFSFSRWDLGEWRISPELIAKLPIPDSPFGLTLTGYDGCLLEPGALRALARFRDTLVELELWGADITDDSLAELRPLSNLRSLGICSTAIWEKPAIERLADLPNLETLRLSQTRLGAAEGEALSRLPRLRELYLQVSTASDIGLESLATLGRLEAIDLSIADLTNEAASQLAGLRALRFLDLGNSSVSDGPVAGVSKARIGHPCSSDIQMAEGAGLTKVLHAGIR